jgi:transcriptional regulator with XRE-family HTH domain
MSLRRNVAENLRTTRLRQKLSQEQVAERCCLSISYVSMLERGMRVPPLDTLETLAKALGVHPVELLRELAQGGRRSSA